MVGSRHFSVGGFFLRASSIAVWAIFAFPASAQEKDQTSIPNDKSLETGAPKAAAPSSTPGLTEDDSDESGKLSEAPPVPAGEKPSTEEINAPAKPLSTPTAPQESAVPATPNGNQGGITLPQTIDQDGNMMPAPIYYSFRQANTFDGKIGSGLFYARTDPYGASTGYGQFFAEGDWSIFGTGLGLHFDFDVRGALGLFEKRDLTFLPHNNPETDRSESPADFYRYPGILATGRTSDYLRVDKLSLSYDVSFLGLEFGRARIPEAAFSVVDGLKIQLIFDSFRFGFFGGLRPNPWHQQVVGAASGGFQEVPEAINLGIITRSEFSPVRPGETDQDASWTYLGETTGPYSNEIGLSMAGLGTPWSQLGSYRFQSFGAFTSLRIHPAFLDAALVLDTFFDPNTGIEEPVQTGELDPDSDIGFLVDRLWLYTSGGVRLFRPLTLSWRATLDVIGARPLAPRDLYIDATWRNLGPIRFSATYYKINTMSTAYSYARFFRPIENPAKLEQLDQNEADLANGELDYTSISINNANLYVVDRDRLRAEVALLLGESLEIYSNIIGERRGDYLYAPSDDPLQSAEGLLNGIDSQSQSVLENFICMQPEFTGDDVAPEGTLVGTNPAVPVYSDRCKVGFAIGMRDPVLANVGYADLRYTMMQGYFSTSSRFSAHLGVAVSDRLYLDAGGAYEHNQSARVYSPIFPTVDLNAPNNGPYALVPKDLDVYEGSINATLRIAWGWHLDASYLGYLEDLPYQGEALYGNEPPLRRDTHQFTQILFFRNTVRF
jgi:hypothetical protein